MGFNISARLHRRQGGLHRLSRAEARGYGATKYFRDRFYFPDVNVRATNSLIAIYDFHAD